MPSLTVRVPDIGEFEQVDVVEVLVHPGDRISAGDPLIVIESEKASMEVPSPASGVVISVAVAVDDQVSEGSQIVVMDTQEESTGETPSLGGTEAQPAQEASSGSEKSTGGQTQATAETPSRVAVGAERRQADVVVLGGGPGGYTAAFRAADLGRQVVLVEPHSRLGGVCLNVGCIPSKTLLHMAAVLEEADGLREHGVELGRPRFDFDRIRARKDEVVGTLAGGLSKLASQRGVEVMRGEGRFAGPDEILVGETGGGLRLGFRAAIVAVGSRAVRLPGLPDDPRILDSTAALEVEGPPARMLVVGGGIIGLEMATVYAAFGTRVCVVELLDHLMDGADRDLLRPLERRLARRLEGIWLATRMLGIDARDDALHVRLDGKDAPEEASYDRVLVAVGRRPNGDRLDAECAGLHVDERGFVPVDARLRTNLPNVHAIGDVVGPPLLAHKATHQGKVAAEVIAGLPASFDARAIPAVAYTDPEVAWTGLTEAAARSEGRAVRKAVFPWSASGRALGMGRGEGLTKLLFSEEDGRLLGAGIVGAHAGELIAEATLAIEMGADAQDLGLTIHPHPTLSETLAFAAETASGTITDLLPPRRR